VRRDFTIARTYRLAFTLEAIAALVGLAIFSGVGEIVDSADIEAETGVEGGYFAFASVGIAVSGMLLVCCAAFAQRVRDDQTTGAFEAMLASPVDPKLLVMAGAAYELVKALVFGVLTMLFAVVLFGVVLQWQGTDTLVALLVALPGLVVLLAGVGIVVAAVGVVSKDPGPVVGLATSAVALLAGAYFPITALPEPLETIAEILPVTWGLDALRAGLLGGDVDVAECLGLLAIALVVFPAALIIFERAIDIARRRGSLGEY
jgi:ABC-2 type transport system permease protein